MWYERVRGLEEDGELVVLGLVQEQHPDRTALFAQWQRFDFPILWDPFNLTGSTAVPNRIAIDEHGVVRGAPADLGSIEVFVETEHEAPTTTRPWWRVESPERLDARVAEWERAYVEAVEAGHKDDFLESHHRVDSMLSDLLWLDPTTSDRPDRALQWMAVYEAASGLSPQLKSFRKADLLFRFGVALRLAYDADHWTVWVDPEPDPVHERERVDVQTAFQGSIDAWREALELDPNQYIYRRRIQQYGPRQDKPYPFYDWVARAQEEVRARGAEPVAVRVPLTGSELAGRQAFAEAAALENPDPDGKIVRADDWVSVQTATAADTTGRSRTTRVHVAFSLPSDGQVHWNNEAEPLTVWVDLPDGWSLDPVQLTVPNPRAATSGEDRHLDFEVRAPDDSEGPTRVSGFALFNVCETADGRCLYRRCDFEVEL